MKCTYSWNCPPGSIPYIIREGDTLYSIARRYQTTVDRLIEVNSKINPDNLIVGSEICIPQPIESYPFCRTTNYYVVQPGDTIYSISRYFGVSEQQILYSNMGVTPENIYNGMVLCIPIAKPPVCVTVENNELILDFTSGEEERFPCRGEVGEVLTTISMKQLTGSDGEGKKLMLAVGDTSICSESVCGKNDIILTLNDMDRVFNYVTVGTEVSIL